MDSENLSPLLPGDRISINGERVPPNESAVTVKKFSALDRIGKYYDLSEVKKRDLALYFLLGAFNDLDCGYTGSASFTSLIALPNFNVAPTTFAVTVGGLVGSLLTTFILMRFRPAVRIVVLAAIQFTGG